MADLETVVAAVAQLAEGLDKHPSDEYIRALGNELRSRLGNPEPTVEAPTDPPVADGGDGGESAPAESEPAEAEPANPPEAPVG